MNLFERPEQGAIRIGDFSMDLTDKTALENVMEGLAVVKKLPVNN
jgi:hypothetical protein